MKVRFIMITALYLAMQFAPVVLWGQKTEKIDRETYAVIERDTIQTRNFVPVINHEAMIVNLTEQPLKVAIHSPLPRGKYMKDSPQSAFGNNSLLGAPIFAPFPISPRGHTILGKPDVTETGHDITYCWNNVSLSPAAAVIAQYDNYYGPRSDFYRDFGLEIAGLQVISDYSVKKNKDIYRLSLNITLKNRGEQAIEELFFRIFFPTDVYRKGEEESTELAIIDEIWGSDNVNISHSTIADGYNRTAKGIDASSLVGTIPASSNIRFVLQIDCRKKTETGEIYPLLYILGRSKYMRMWPETKILPEKEAGKPKKFHYLFYNLVIPDRFILRISKNDFRWIPAES